MYCGLCYILEPHLHRLGVGTLSLSPVYHHPRCWRWRGANLRHCRPVRACVYVSVACQCAMATFWRATPAVRLQRRTAGERKRQVKEKTRTLGTGTDRRYGTSWTFLSVIHGLAIFFFYGAKQRTGGEKKCHFWMPKKGEKKRNDAKMSAEHQMAR